MVVLGGGAVAYERGTPVRARSCTWAPQVGETILIRFWRSAFFYYVVRTQNVRFPTTFFPEMFLLKFVRKRPPSPFLMIEKTSETARRPLKY